MDIHFNVISNYIGANSSFVKHYSMLKKVNEYPTMQFFGIPDKSTSGKQKLKVHCG